MIPAPIASKLHLQVVAVAVRADAMLIAVLALQLVTAAVADPFAFFQPSVRITVDDRRKLENGEPIAHVLPGDDLEVGVFAAVPVKVDGDRLARWIRRIEELKKSTYVPDRPSRLTGRSCAYDP